MENSWEFYSIMRERQLFTSLRDFFSLGFPTRCGDLKLICRKLFPYVTSATCPGGKKMSCVCAGWGVYARTVHAWQRVIGLVSISHGVPHKKRGWRCMAPHASYSCVDNSPRCLLWVPCKKGASHATGRQAATQENLINNGIIICFSTPRHNVVNMQRPAAAGLLAPGGLLLLLLLSSSIQLDILRVHV